jgi:hypothetical protein
MKITIDPELLVDTSRPLREASEVARDVHRGSRALTGHADYVGHPELSRAIGEFLGAWSQTLDAVAGHGETMARMLNLAGTAFRDQDDIARRHATSLGGQP